MRSEKANSRHGAIRENERWFPMNNIRGPGQSISFSDNACVLRFVGGPWHGACGLYDHPYWKSINVWMLNEDKTYVYRRTGKFTYALFDTVSTAQ